MPKTGKPLIEESLLYRYEQRECTPSEKREVEAWLKADSAHQKKFKELKKIWEVELIEEDYTGFDTKKAWKRFKDQNIESQNKKTHSINSVRDTIRWGYYAAAAVILIAVGIYSYQNFYKPSLPVSPSPQKIVTEKGERTRITLGDNTKITLNAASTLTIPADYMVETRTVHLKGEAFFEVQHNEELPFIVVSGDRYAKDLGTKFNVNTYESKVLEVAVQEGAVSMGEMDGNSPKEAQADLTAHQVGTLSESGRVNIQKVEDFDLFSGWTKGKLVFNEAPFAKVCRQLERRFDVECVIEDQSLNQRTLTASYNDIPLNEVLDVLSLTLDISYNKKNGIITFRDN